MAASKRAVLRILPPSRPWRFSHSHWQSQLLGWRKGYWRQEESCEKSSGRFFRFFGWPRRLSRWFLDFESLWNQWNRLKHSHQNVLSSKNHSVFCLHNFAYASQFYILIVELIHMPHCLFHNKTSNQKQKCLYSVYFQEILTFVCSRSGCSI